MPLLCFRHLFPPRTLRRRRCFWEFSPAFTQEGSRGALSSRRTHSNTTPAKAPETSTRQVSRPADSAVEAQATRQALAEPVPASPLKELGSDYDFIKVYGGSGKVSRLVSAEGWRVGPAIDLSTSEHFVDSFPSSQGPSPQPAHRSALRNVHHRSSPRCEVSCLSSRVRPQAAENPAWKSARLPSSDLDFPLPCTGRAMCHRDSSPIEVFLASLRQGLSQESQHEL